MIDLVLGLIIISLVALIGWLDWNNRKERSKLLNAIIAKTSRELVDLEFADKVQPEPIVVENPDAIPLDQLTEQEFDRHIMEQTNG